MIENVNLVEISFKIFARIPYVGCNGIIVQIKKYLWEKEHFFQDSASKSSLSPPVLPR